MKLASLLIAIFLLMPSELVYKINEADLVIYYKSYNDTYFDGKLPPATIHFVNNLRDEKGRKLMGQTFMATPIRILINSEYKDTPKVVLETLIHEECHVATDSVRVEFDNDGPRWNQCMLKLAEAGAFKDVW